MYYTTPASRKSEVKGYWCHACYTDHRSDTIEVSDVGRLRKSELEKKKNDEEVCRNLAAWNTQGTVDHPCGACLARPELPVSAAPLLGMHTYQTYLCMIHEHLFFSPLHQGMPAPGSMVLPALRAEVQQLLLPHVSAGCS